MAKEAPASQADATAQETPATKAAAATPPAAEKSKPSRSDPKALAAQRRQRTRVQYSMPFVSNSVTLKSFHAQQTYDRGFMMGEDALHTLSVVLRVLAPEEECVKVDEILNTELGNASKELKSELTRLEKLAETRGVTLTGLAYSLPREVSPKITSPRASMYLALIRDLDRVVEAFDALWLAHQISDSEHNKGIFKVKRRILRLAGTFRLLVKRSMASAQRKDVNSVEDTRSGEQVEMNPAALDAPANATPNPFPIKAVKEAEAPSSTEAVPA